MSLLIDTFVLGPIGNNTYVVTDQLSHDSVLIDPSFESLQVLKHVQRMGFHLTQIWLTHAHFDHIAGIHEIHAAGPSSLPIGLHPDDLDLYASGGGASQFGISMKRAGKPDLLFAHGQVLTLGSSRIEVRHTPGHTPGHVVFYCAEENVLFSGDLIFEESVGRTDLPGGSHAHLLESIHSQVLTLPHPTRILSGHGHETSVGHELVHNPFL